MIYGVGVDIEDHRRFEKYISSNDGLEHLLPIYSQKELYNYSQFNSHLCYALSFSCKEAVFKAFGQDWGEECMWNDIELIFNESPEKGKAKVFFNGYAKQIIREQRISDSVDIEYRIDESKVIFQSILLCKTN